MSTPAGARAAIVFGLAFTPAVESPPGLLGRLNHRYTDERRLRLDAYPVPDGGVALGVTVRFR